MPSCVSDAKSSKSEQPILYANVAPPNVAVGLRLRAAAWLLTVAGTDQALKSLVTHFVPVGASVPLLPGVLALTHVHNPGIAFSLGEGISPLVPAAIALTLVFLLFYNKARWNTTAAGRLTLVLAGGGALGNLIDRLRVGAVIDYLDFHIWPVFNLADAAVVIGAGLAILALIRGTR